METFTHFDQNGISCMVDISNKHDTQREAVVRGSISMNKETFGAIKAGSIAKGDVLAVAKVAGIMAAKKTPELIPMCHPLNIASVKIDFFPIEKNSRIDIEARVKIFGRTGVEMEALVAVCASAMTIYDMCKAVDKEMVISDIYMKEKQGGKSGHYQRTGKPISGRIIAVNRAEKRGVSKENIKKGFLKESWGLVGDAHGGDWDRQISIFPLEALQKVPLQIMDQIEDNDYSENITTIGIPPEEFQIGSKWKINEAIIEICHIGKEKFKTGGRPYIVSREGRFGRILKGGDIRVGDDIGSLK